MIFYFVYIVYLDCLEYELLTLEYDDWLLFDEFLIKYLNVLNNQQLIY